MAQSNKLSLLSAILINVNIMLGTGVFINTVILTNAAGALGALVYALVGILILPLIVAFSRLLAYHPGGTFYDFGKTLSPAWGFLSSWSYFIGKLATSALGIHIFTTLMQQLSPTLASYNTLALNSVLIGLFIFFNMFNIKTGRNINYLFIFLKFIPIIFVVCSALFLFDGAHFTPDMFIWSGIPCCAPFVLFAFAGFEASCSLSKSIENPEKNGPKAILISYFITLITVIAYQLGFFGILGSYLGTLNNFQESLPVLITKVFPANMTQQMFFKALTLIGVAASSLGASYGVIYTNIWNLHALATAKHTFAADLIARKNRFSTPFVCVFIAGFIVFNYLFFTGGYQVPLQQIAAFGAVLTYTISTLSLAKTCFFKTQNGRALATLALISCGLLMHTTFMSAQKYGINALLVYSTIIIAGLIMFYLSTPQICTLSKLKRHQS